MKTRYAGQVAAILAASPESMILTRPESEGLDKLAIVDGYRQFHEAFAGLNRPHRWLAHELSNESNHPEHMVFWHEHGGGANYYDQVFQALLTIKTLWGESAINRCRLGGLVPYLQQPWVSIHERLEREFPGLRRCAHLYSTWDQGDVWAQASGNIPGTIISEANISQPAPGTNGVEANIANFERAAREGVTAMVLFCHAPGNNGEWAEFVPSLEDQRRILAAGSAVPAPVPVPDPVPEPEPIPEEDPMFEFVLGFKALADKLGADVVGTPEENEHYFDPAHTFQSTTKGLMWYSKGGQPKFIPGFS